LEIEIAECELANRRRGHVLEGRTGPFQVSEGKPFSQTAAL
jgi:hypothetical protein